MPATLAYAHETMTVLVHPEETRLVWVLERRHHTAGWLPIDMPPQRLFEMLEWYVSSACNPDEAADLRFRNVETAETIPFETAYARFFPSG